MGKLFERSFGLGRAEMVARVLEIQTEAYGYLDVPILSRELSRYNGGEALDVGTGDGSFLLKIAEWNPALNYRGIEPVYDFYDCAPPQKIWREFRERMLATYALWQSHPNIPKQICQWLSAAGFESISVSITIFLSGCTLCVTPLGVKCL